MRFAFIAKHRHIWPVVSQQFQRLCFRACGDHLLDQRIGQNLFEAHGNHQLVFENQHA